MESVYIDSNVFFYAKIMDNVYGRSCAGLLRRIVSGQLKSSISTFVPIEVANALMKYGLKDEVSTEVRAIFSSGLDVYPIEEADVREATELYKEVKVSPYDCVHAAVMKKHGLKEIISADKDFDRFTWLKRTDPKSLAQVR